MSHAQISQQLEVRNSYFADVQEAAHFIQDLLQPALKAPEAGIYLPGQMEPVLKAGQQYWYESPQFLPGSVIPHNQQQWGYFTYEYYLVENFEQVMTSPWDIVNINPNYNTSSLPKVVVLPHHLASTALLAPDLPVAGIKIAHQLIHNEIESTRLYQSSVVKTVEEIIQPFIRDEMMPQGRWVNDAQRLEYLQHDRWFQQASSQIYDSMLLVLSAVRSVLRDNGYQMCTVQCFDNYRVRIDQLGDYRIREYERMLQDPHYQRWLKAKTDGSWDRFLSEQDERDASTTSYETHSRY